MKVSHNDPIRRCWGRKRTGGFSLSHLDSGHSPLSPALPSDTTACLVVL